MGREKENDFPLFSPQNPPLSAPRSTHTAQPFWKNLPKIRAFFFIGTNVLLVVQMPLALLSTSLSSTLPCSKYQENHPVP